MYERNPEQGQVLVLIEPDQREDDEVVEDNEDDWRVYLDLYGFLTLSTLETSLSMEILHL